MSKSIPTILSEWLPESEYVQVFCTTKNIINTEGQYCLNYRDLVIYSCLAFRTKNSELTLRKKIEKKLGFDFGSINKSLNKLELFRLVERQPTGEFIALEPNGESRNWFAFHRNIDITKNWYDNITYYRFYLVNSCWKRDLKIPQEKIKINNKSMLTFMENAVLWVVCSICKEENDNTISKDFQRKSGIAALCLMSEKGVSNSLKRLKELKLVTYYLNTLIVHRPTEQLYWKPRPVEKTEVQPETTAKELILSEYLNLKIGGNIDKFIIKEVDRLGKLLTTTYGCQNDYSIIRETFQYVFDKFPIRRFQDGYFQFFNGVFNELIEAAYLQHNSQIQYSGSCAKLLKHKVEDFINKLNN